MCFYQLIPQGTSSKCFNSSKTSRISLVDLAALDRNKVDDGGRQIVREGKHLKKSLSQLGYDDAMSLKLYFFFLSFIRSLFCRLLLRICD
jgi:hypothetical protein